MGFIKSYAYEKAKLSFGAPCICVDFLSHTHILLLKYFICLSGLSFWNLVPNRILFLHGLGAECWAHCQLEIKTAIFLLCHVNICNGQGNHSSKFAGDCCFITCSCMLIGRDYSSLYKRHGFLQAFSTYSSLRQVPNRCSFCFHHLGSCCRVISCNVLDFIILRLDDSGSPALQITRPQYKFFLY